MTIADQITRLNNAKAAIKNSIENKGVAVSNTAKLDEYAALIDSIKVGSGGSGGDEDDWLKIRTNNYSNFGYLFYRCYATSLDVNTFDTSKATGMEYMFYSCFNLTSLYVSSFNTSNVGSMEKMFWNCRKLTSLDLSNFNTAKVTDMSSMFYACESLTSLDVSNFDTAKVTDMSSMFYACYDLIELNLSSFDTSAVTKMGDMFYNCAALTSLDVSSFNTSKVTDMSSMFSGCTSLTSLDLSNFDASKVTSSTNLRIFGTTANNMPQLTDFKAPKNMGANLDFSPCPNLTHDSLMSIINNLAKVTSTKKLVLGSTNLAKLSDEDKAIATNRGWTLS